MARENPDNLGMQTETSVASCQSMVAGHQEHVDVYSKLKGTLANSLTSLILQNTEWCWWPQTLIVTPKNAPCKIVLQMSDTCVTLAGIFHVTSHDINAIADSCTLDVSASSMLAFSRQPIRTLSHMISLVKAIWSAAAHGGSTLELLKIAQTHLRIPGQQSPVRG